MRHCRVMVFEKPEVKDETGWDAHRRKTSHDAGMIDTANVARTTHIWHMTFLQYRRFIRDIKFMSNEHNIVFIDFYNILCEY